MYPVHPYHFMLLRRLIVMPLYHNGSNPDTLLPYIFPFYQIYQEVFHIPFLFAPAVLSESAKETGYIEEAFKEKAFIERNKLQI